MPGPDAAAIERSVQRRHLRGVWHLTRLGQLKDILKLGALISRSQLDDLGIKYGMSGWGSDQKSEEMKDYICCSVILPWGMSRQESEEKMLITLRPRLLWRRGTLFCGKWSSFGDVTLTTLLSNQNVDSFDIMFPNETSNFPSPVPGEFLVPDCIPLSKFLRNIYFGIIRMLW